MPALRRFILLVLPLTVCPVCGDGVFVMPERVKGQVGATSTQQKGIVIQLREGREALLLQTTYQGRASEFAWVIPVPGEPLKEDVFVANGEFMEDVFRTTAPEVETDIERAKHWDLFGTFGAKAGGPGGMAMEAEAPTVTLHRRMDVGDYDASVLSATDAEPLVGWLKEHKYAIPDDSEDVFDHYIGQDWYFVALRIRPDVVENQPVVSDVQPIGIRFETDKLIYPLYISRGSSPRKTAMLIVTFTDGPVECPQLPVVNLPFNRKLGPGTSYERIRRQTVAGSGETKPVAVCEYRGYGGLGDPGLHFAEDQWPARTSIPIGLMWATRLWTMIGRDQMADLHFEPAARAPASRVAISRRGTVASDRPWLFSVPSWAIGAGLVLVLLFMFPATGRRPQHIERVALFAGTLALLAGVGPGVLAGVLFVACAAVLVIAVRQWWRASQMADQFESEGGIGFGRAAIWMVLAAGWFALAARIAVGRGAWFPPDEVWQALWQAVWLYLVVHELIRGMGDWSRARLIAFGIVLVGALALQYWLVPMRYPEPALAVTWVFRLWLNLILLGFWGLFSYVLVGPVEPSDVRRPAAAMSLSVLVLAAGLLVPRVRLFAPAWAGAIPHTGIQQLDRALKDIDEALGDFADDLGCYPKSLRDLTAARNPEAGIDSSGNEVPIGGNWQGAYLQQLPVDALTGRTDSWVYEVTAAPMVDSGGYTITLSREPTPERGEVYGAGNRRLLSSFAPGYPFTNYSRLPCSYGERTGWPSDDTMLRIIRTREHRGLLVADIAAKQARALTTAADRRERVEPEAICISPDGTRLASACELRHTAYIGACDLYPRASDADHPGSGMRAGTNHSRLLPRPWDAQVLDIAWHPTEPLWAIAARPAVTDEAEKPRARLYILDGKSEPRMIPSSQGCIAVRWAPDGSGLVAMRVSGDDERSDGLTPATLERISIEGESETLVRDAYVELFAMGGAGIVATRGDDELVLIDNESNVTPLAIPPGHAGITRALIDIWVGEASVAVACCWDTSEDTGSVYLYSPADSQPRLIGNFHTLLPEDATTLRIIGFDRERSTLIVSHGLDLSKQYGGTEAFYALRPEEPRSERLPAKEIPKSITASWAGDEITVQPIACVPPSAFEVGDFIADSPGTDRPTKVSMVAAIEGRDLIAGGGRVAIKATTPVLGRTDHYWKCRRR